MIVFSALVPHPPLLIPTIGKDNLSFVKKTITAMERLSEELYAAKPDTIVIISPHGPMLADAFALNIAPKFAVGFKDFGDLATIVPVKGDVGLAHHFKEILEGKLPVVLINRPELDHGAGVPLYFLMKNASQRSVSLVPISYSLLDYQTHYEFGRLLQEDMINDTKRLAIIASGDLSHRLTADAPAGFSHWAKKFDELLVQKLLKKDISGILHLDNDLIEEAGECGLRSLIIMLGMLNSMRFTPELYSYEGPFGVGYGVVNCKLAR